MKISDSLRGRLWLYGTAVLTVGLAIEIRNSVEHFVTKDATKIIKLGSKEQPLNQSLSLKPRRR